MQINCVFHGGKVTICCSSLDSRIFNNICDRYLWMIWQPNRR